MGTTLNTTLTEELAAVAAAWRRAPHGRKGPILDEAAQRLQMARATLHRRLKEVVVTPPRKQRSDAGQVCLSLDDAKLISALLMEHMRKNGKMLKSVADAVRVLRANGLVEAKRTDPATGEVVPLSESAILRALYTYRLHPEQLLAPAPAISLRSLHPNHVWQIDASRCVLYYLPRSGSDNGLRIAEASEYYKNKPSNIIKAIKAALWRYVVTDHASGQIFVIYVVGGETAANLIDAFIAAMTLREGEVMHGVPAMVMLDPGSANTSASFMNLCRALRVRVQINTPGNPRAKGQVEKAQDIVERSFESTLRLLAPDQVDTLEKINALAAKWRRWFNGTAIHTRHHRTRDAAWLHITPEQLVLAPAADVLRAVAVNEPESRVVTPQLRVPYKGEHYNVAHVPGVIVGQKLMICRNPWRDDAAQVVGVDAEGREVYHVVERVVLNEFGQAVDAPVIGESYARHADTPAQINAKELEQLATGTTSESEAKAARRARTAPFGGAIDPFKHIDDAPVPASLPRRGRAHELVAPAVVLPPLTHIQAAKRLKRLVPDWSPEHYARLQALFPDGVPADGIDAAARALGDSVAPAAHQPALVRVA